MNRAKSEAKEAWSTIALFLLILTPFSLAAHAAIVWLNPVSIYVGALMICPTLAALMTQKIKGRRISDLPWRWGDWPSNIQSYLIPFSYVAIAYIIVWSIGLGGFGNTETFSEWSAELGLSAASPVVASIAMVVLLATVQFIKSLGTILGEEMGWRGFLIFELRKVMPFGGVSIVSGVIWAVWHYPIIITYGGGDTIFQLACFTVMLTSMSVIMTYYTFKSQSVWPAVMFHGAHNIFIQKVFTPLTSQNEQTSFWIDEYGLMLPIVVTVMAMFFWRKAKAEGY